MITSSGHSSSCLLQALNWKFKLLGLVSCFGSESESDTGDYWRLLIEGSGKTWKQDQRVRLQHVDTSGYLHSHDKKYTRIAGGQQEVCGVRDKRADNVWLAAEGVYLPVTESK
ncbi:Stromal cell-derived factor 2-like protein [Vitis vinifera]|uniref:Stromal cell-derived factor 2-like protein n=1 Tax=Vitis vinifera TaxID=29760 RepID=A0A438FZE8_VITVI|nr:Stromal cell-derived factor 2-like protein [Vitis vinifera]